MAEKEKKYWKATQNMHGKALLAASNARMKADWRTIRTGLKMKLPFRAQMHATQLHLRQSFKDSKPSESVRTGRQWRKGDDPEHCEDSPSFASLFELAKSEDAANELYDSQVNAFFGDEMHELLDEDASDPDGGPIGAIALAFLNEYAVYCKEILDEKREPLQGAARKANEAMLHGCRVVAAMIRSEPHVYGTEYAETLRTFSDLPEEDELHPVVHMFFELLQGSEQWKPKVATYITEADNDDVTGPRNQAMLRRLVGEDATIELAKAGLVEVKWLMQQKHRPGGFNRLLVSLAEATCTAAGDSSKLSPDESTSIVEVLQDCKKFLSMDVEFPAKADELLQALKEKSVKERKATIKNDITAACRSWNGDVTELAKFVQHVDLIRDDNSFGATFSQDLKDMRGNILSRTVRLVKASDRRSDDFNHEALMYAKAMGAITQQSVVKANEDEKEVEIVQLVVKLSDLVIDLKEVNLLVAEEVQDDPVISKDIFVEHLEKARDYMGEYDTVIRDADSGGHRGSSYIAQLETEGDSFKTHAQSLVDEHCDRLDKLFQAGIEKETKRVSRVAGGGDKTKWKDKCSGKEVTTDQQFMKLAKALENSFHEADFADRCKNLLQDTLISTSIGLRSGASSPRTLAGTHKVFHLQVRYSRVLHLVARLTASMQCGAVKRVVRLR